MNCKYYKQKKQVSYDNGVTWYDLSEYRTGSLYESGGTDCNQYTPIYRWVNTTGYMCNGTSKYARMKKQVSYDNGVTYIDVVPAEYMAGSLIEYNSEDCQYHNRYLTIESLDDNNQISFKTNITSYTKTISASTDNGSTWAEYTSTTGGTIIATLNNGQKVLIKGLNASYANGQFNRCGFSSTDHFIVYGNIMSLISGDSFTSATTLTSDRTFVQLFSCSGLTSAENLILPATTLANYCYDGMFWRCYNLTTAPSILPATTLAISCYFQMFEGCTRLTTAPELPATTLAAHCCSYMFDSCHNLTKAPELPATNLSGADYCYFAMFANCTSLTVAPSILPATNLSGADYCYLAMFEGCSGLTTAPELPATTLANKCYAGMFKDCYNLTTAPSILPATTLADYCYENMFMSCYKYLTTAPELPATTLANNCYQGMFRGCGNLRYIKCLATNISATDCTDIWVESVSANGTFVKNPNMSSWTTGKNGIPDGWTIQNA